MKEAAKKTFKHVLTPDKVQHSKHVKKLACDMGCNNDIKKAALYHDYIENGGKKSNLKNLLDPHAFNLVQGLTNNKKKDVLDSMKKKLKKATEQEKIDLIKLKLADRAANIDKRIKENKLKSKYINKTAKLVNYLYKQYPADKNDIKSFIKKKFIDKSADLKSKIDV